MSGRRRTRCKACGTLAYDVSYGRCRACRENGNPRQPKPEPESRHDVHHYASMSAALAVADTESTTIANADLASRSDLYGAEWSGTDTYTEASALAHHGWTEPRESVNDIVGSITGELRELVIESVAHVHDVSGCEVDVSTYLTGQPECMVDYVLAPETAHREVVTILASVVASAGVSSERIQRRGAAVCALVDLVARAGYTVEVWADSSVTRNGMTETQQIRVHAPEDRLDVDAIMFALAHPAMLRRVMFSLMEHATSATRRRIGSHSTGGGYGAPTPPAADRLPHAPTITLGNVHSGSFDTPEQTAAWVRTQLANLGILKDGG